MVKLESLDDDISNYPEGLVLVPRGTDDGSFVVGPHVRGGRLKAASATGDEEVDLLLPGTARYDHQTRKDFLLIFVIEHQQKTRVSNPRMPILCRYDVSFFSRHLY